MKKDCLLSLGLGLLVLVGTPAFVAAQANQTPSSHARARVMLSDQTPLSGRPDPLDNDGASAKTPPPKAVTPPPGTDGPFENQPANPDPSLTPKNIPDSDQLPPSSPEPQIQDQTPPPPQGSEGGKGMMSPPKFPGQAGVPPATPRGSPEPGEVGPPPRTAITPPPAPSAPSNRGPNTMMRPGEPGSVPPAPSPSPGPTPGPKLRMPDSNAPPSGASPSSSGPTLQMPSPAPAPGAVPPSPSAPDAHAAPQSPPNNGAAQPDSNVAPPDSSQPQGPQLHMPNPAPAPDATQPSAPAPDANAPPVPPASQISPSSMPRVRRLDWHTGRNVKAHRVYARSHWGLHTEEGQILVVSAEQLDLYPAPGAKRPIATLHRQAHLVPIFREGKWLKVEDPTSGHVGWVSLKPSEEATDSIPVYLFSPAGIITATPMIEGLYDLMSHLKKKVILTPIG